MDGMIGAEAGVGGTVTLERVWEYRRGLYLVDKMHPSSTRATFWRADPELRLGRRSRHQTRVEVLEPQTHPIFFQASVYWPFLNANKPHLDLSPEAIRCTLSRIGTMAIDYAGFIPGEGQAHALFGIGLGMVSTPISAAHGDTIGALGA